MLLFKHLPSGKKTNDLIIFSKYNNNMQIILRYAQKSRSNSNCWELFILSLFLLDIDCFGFALFSTTYTLSNLSTLIIACCSPFYLVYWCIYRIWVTVVPFVVAVFENNVSTLNRVPVKDCWLGLAEDNEDLATGICVAYCDPIEPWFWATIVVEGWVEVKVISGVCA